MTTPDVLTVTGAKKRFGDVVALDGADASGAYDRPATAASNTRHAALEERAEEPVAARVQLQAAAEPEAEE